MMTNTHYRMLRIYLQILPTKEKYLSVFSLVDLSGAYNQLEVEEKSAPLLTLNTHKWLYHTLHLAYGVKTAPSIFQKTMDQILSGIENVMCFVDDILLTSDSESEMVRLLDQVLTRLRQHNVRLNKAKCQFFKSKVQYLGHILSAEGIQPIQDKVEAIKLAPPPTNLTELQSFLGMVNYYGKFIPNLSSVLHPLYDLLKAGVKWSWDAACESSFKKCKKLLSDETVLTHYD